jgi:hypothetical protein
MSDLDGAEFILGEGQKAPPQDENFTHSEFHYEHDNHTPKVGIARYQDVEPILENNKILQTSGDGYNEARDMRRVASIPMIVVEKWMVEDGVNFLALSGPERSKYLKKKLNDPEWRHLRTALFQY